MLSLHTNRASLVSQNALQRSGQALAQSQTRLATGRRVNSAMDDASGLQVATRLKAQSSGMAVAMRNTRNSISMLQTAEGLMDTVGTILIRIQDLAIQAADASSTDDDRAALHAEYVLLSEQVLDTIHETPYNGSPLIRYTVSTPGTLGSGPQVFQIGASPDETMSVDFRPALGRLNGSLYYAIDGGNLAGYPVDAGGTELTSSASANVLVGKVGEALADVGQVRAQLGATANRLESVHRNLSNIKTNTEVARGRIVDTDFASETAAMTASQMLMQSGTAMLKQTNSMSQLVISLLQ
ncbi:Lateral flagellin [Massilia sp. IC2-477]|uniref:flagellin N-terminal helical domain-containing protein n=1 Tax=Massilia sp. IC2-477 TaxID=2887198 RepID=UPI001D12D8F4|nr:flagellin [Massilia sp. IC2-477]MCC2957494.1 Lateral flagellin [Massilia sp. IC2-477]